MVKKCKYNLHHTITLTSCIEPFQIAVTPNNSTNKFINAHAYKLLEPCHDMHTACDKQITPWYSLRSAYLTTWMKSTRIKELKTPWFKMLLALKSALVALVFYNTGNILFSFSHFSSVCFLPLFVSARPSLSVVNAHTPQLT